MHSSYLKSAHFAEETSALSAAALYVHRQLVCGVKLFDIQRIMQVRAHFCPYL